jgi:hypothetical protein
VDIGPFWEENKRLLRKIVALRTHPYSTLNYSEYGADYIEDLDRYLVYFSAFRLGRADRRFRCVSFEAYIEPKTFKVENETIKYSIDSIDHGYLTTLGGEEIGLRHKKWLRSILEKVNNKSLSRKTNHL